MIEFTQEVLIYGALEILFVIFLAFLVIKRFRHQLTGLIQLELMDRSGATKESFKFWFKILIFLILAGMEIAVEAMLGAGIAIASPISLLVIFATALCIFFDKILYYGGPFWSFWNNFITSFLFVKMGPPARNCIIKVRESGTSFYGKHVMDMHFTATAITNTGCTVEFVGTRDLPPNKIQHIRTWVSPSGGSSQSVFVEGQAYISKRQVPAGDSVAIGLDFVCKCPAGQVGNKTVTLLWCAYYK